MGRLGTIFGSHWRGTLSPGLALAGPLLAVHLGMAALLYLLRGAGPLLIAPLVALQSGVLLWQVVGLFRTADKSLQGFGGGQVATLIYAAILGVVGSSFVQTAGLLASGHSVIAEIARPAAPVSTDGSVLRLDGEITFQAFDALKGHLAGEDGFEVLVLTSDGGNIHAARGIARLVAEAGLETAVEGNCFSACTLVFVAGNRRVLQPGGRLGFHRYRQATFEKMGSGLYPDARSEQQWDRGYFAARGIAEDFVNRIHETGHEAIWQPSRQELLSARVITD